MWGSRNITVTPFPGPLPTFWTGGLPFIHFFILPFLRAGHQGIDREWLWDERGCRSPLLRRCSKDKQSSRATRPSSTEVAEWCQKPIHWACRNGLTFLILSQFTEVNIKSSFTVPGKCLHKVWNLRKRHIPYLVCGSDADIPVVHHKGCRASNVYYVPSLIPFHLHSHLDGRVSPLHPTDEELEDREFTLLPDW